MDVTTVMLGWKLARASGWRRGVPVIVGVAVGMVVLLTAVAVPTTIADPGQSGKQFIRIVIVALAVPVVTLLAAVVRLSASVRDRRLAALRILGVSAGATRTAAAVEAVVVAAAGVLLGALGFLAIRPLIRAVEPHGRAWFHGGSLLPRPSGWLAVTVLVLGVCAVVAVSPARAVTRAPITTRRAGSVRRPGLWRLIPLTGGVVALGYDTVRYGHATAAALIGPFLVGATLTGLGLPLAMPVVIRLGADHVARHAKRPALLLAARRTQQEPAAASRIVATVVVAVFVVVGARSVVAVFASTPQAVRAHLALTTGPQAAAGPVRAGRPVDLAALRAVPGVRAIAETSQLGLHCPPARATGQSAEQPAITCTSAVIATCADLPAMRIDVDHCVDGRPMWLLSSDAVTHGDRARINISPVILGTAPGRHTPTTLRLPAISASAKIARPPADDPTWAAPIIGYATMLLLLPPDTPGVAAIASHTRPTLYAVLDGGATPLQQLTDAATRQNITVYTDEQPSDWHSVEDYQTLLWAVGTLLIGLGLVALAFTTVDRALERRAHVAALSVVGVPISVSRRSQLWQTAAPLIVGVPAAVTCGLLAGRSYLSIAADDSDSVPPHLPLQGIAALTAVCILASLAVGALTLIGLGRTPTSVDLRRE